MKSSKTSSDELLSSCRSYNQLHMLYSMLPKQYTPNPTQQFKKTKDFYKPNQCIWNNPHRTSDRLYRYYHKGIDYYKCVKEPVILQKEQEDREIKETSRIIELSKKREEVRTKFYSKKLQRLQLESKVGIKRENFNQLTNKGDFGAFYSKNTTFDTLPVTSKQSIDKSQPVLKRSNSQALRHLPSNDFKQKFLYRKIKTNCQQQVSKNERTYLSSLQNFDVKKKAKIEILKQSQKQMKTRIRQNFTKQKQNNLMSKSGASFGQSKLLKSTFSKKTFQPKNEFNESLMGNQTKGRSEMNFLYQRMR